MIIIKRHILNQKLSLIQKLGNTVIIHIKILVLPILQVISTSILEMKRGPQTMKNAQLKKARLILKNKDTNLKVLKVQ